MRLWNSLLMQFDYLKKLYGTKKILIGCSAILLAILVTVNIILAVLPMPENKAFIDFAHKNGLQVDGRKVLWCDMWVESGYFTTNEDYYNNMSSYKFYQFYNEKYFSNDIINYYKLIGNDPINNSEVLNEAIELNKKINKKIIDADLLEIRCYVYLKESVSVEEAEKIVEKRSHFEEYFNLYEGDEVSIIAMIAWDSEAVKALQEDDRVYFVDTTTDPFHYGYKGKFGSQRFATTSNNAAKTFDETIICRGIDFKKISSPTQ